MDHLSEGGPTPARKKPFCTLLDQTIHRARELGLLTEQSRQAAIDATGLESRHVSRYYIWRQREGARGAYRRRYPKLSAVCDVRSHLLLAMAASRGPRPDQEGFWAIARQAVGRQAIGEPLADAGYDGEHHHVYLREHLGIRSILPPTVGRPSDQPAKGKYRRQLQRRFPHKRFGQRWQIETSFSMLKRRLGSFFRARSYWSQCRELALRVITFNLMIIRCAYASFLQSTSFRF